MFAPNELQLLIAGDDGAIDVDDWQRHTFVFSNFYYYSYYYRLFSTLMQFGPAHECIKWFFEILREFTPAQQRAVLMFGNFNNQKKK